MKKISAYRAISWLVVCVNTILFSANLLMNTQYRWTAQLMQENHSVRALHSAVWIYEIFSIVFILAGIFITKSVIRQDRRRNADRKKSDVLLMAMHAMGALVWLAFGVGIAFSIVGSVAVLR